MIVRREGVKNDMTIFQYLGAFRVFDADVLLLALGVTLVTSLLKKTVFKNASKKLYVILPFVLGAVFYAAYRMLATLSVAPLTETLAQTAEGGFACGCAATLYYVIYEQFVRKAVLSAGQTDEAAAPAAEENTAAGEAAAPAAEENAAAGEAAAESPANGPIAPLLEAFVPADRLAEAAAALTEGSRGLTAEARANFIKTALEKYLSPGMTERETYILQTLLEHCLAALNGA